MHQYRIFNQAGRILRWVVGIPCVLLVFLVGVEFLRLFIILYRQANWLGYALIGAAALAILILIARVTSHRKAHRILNARGYEITGASRHGQLKSTLKYLIHYLKRLASHPLLREEQAVAIRQKAHDFQEALNHHPLNDDLLRAIAAARDQVIAPTFRHLDEINEKVTRSKARAIIQDIYQPPFPIVPPLVVLYHQVTLITEMADIYLSRPSWGEYMRIINDVWKVMTKGDFLRYGQRLFSGIDSNALNLGRAREDLGPAMSIIWMTHCVARVATQRCCTLHDWNLRNAIRQMNRDLPDCLSQTRESMVAGALPILKNHFRHHTPLDGRDPATFAEEIVESFVKSLDAVVRSMHVAFGNRPPAGQTHAEDRMDAPDGPGLTPPPPPAHETRDRHPDSSSVYSGEGDFQRHRRKRRRHKPTGSLGRLFSIFSSRRDRNDPSL